jgi:hypothetical protein
METLVIGYKSDGISWIAEVKSLYHSVAIRRNLSLAEHL